MSKLLKSTLFVCLPINTRSRLKLIKLDGLLIWRVDILNLDMNWKRYKRDESFVSFIPEWNYRAVYLAVFAVPCWIAIVNVNGGALQSDIRKVTVTVRSIKKSFSKKFIFVLKVLYSLEWRQTSVRY